MLNSLELVEMFQNKLCDKALMEEATMLHSISKMRVRHASILHGKILIADLAMKHSFPRRLGPTKASTHCEVIVMDHWIKRHRMSMTTKVGNLLICLDIRKKIKHNCFMSVGRSENKQTLQEDFFKNYAERVCIPQYI